MHVVDFPYAHIFPIVGIAHSIEWKMKEGANL